MSHLQHFFAALTQKVLSSFIQFDTNIEFKYLLKLDDDSFARVPELLDELKHSNYAEGRLFLYSHFYQELQLAIMGECSTYFNRAMNSSFN